MRVRVRIRIRPNASPITNRELALTFSRWMAPLSLGAVVLAVWRLGSDIDRTFRFGISEGFLSHWQVWLATGMLLQVAGSVLGRYGRGDGAAMP